MLLVLPLLVAACARAPENKSEARSPSKSTAAPQQAIESEAGEIVTKREITLTQAAPAEQPQPASVQQTEQQKLLSLDSVQVLPEDFKIGPLADLVGIDRNTVEMVTVSTRFLNALQKGTVDQETLHAEVREELTTSIRYYLERDLIPVNYRIGAITTESYTEGDQQQSPLQYSGAWMNIRLFGTPGVAEGELYLERSGSRWYVSDLQIDFETIGEQYVKEEEAYYPSTYGWGIQ